MTLATDMPLYYAVKKAALLISEVGVQKQTSL
jgi:hypothetical protein